MTVAGSEQSEEGERRLSGDKKHTQVRRENCASHAWPKLVDKRL